MNESTFTEKDFEINTVDVIGGNKSSTLGIVAVSFDIDDSIIATELDSDLDTVSETHDLKILNGRNGSNFRRSLDWWWSEASNLLVVRLSNFSWWTDTDGSMITSSTLGIWSTNVTWCCD